MAENNFEADKRGLWKNMGGSCLYIYLYYRSVLEIIVETRSIIFMIIPLLNNAGNFHKSQD